MLGSINGIQLAHLIRIRWPSIGITATSGQLRLWEDDLPAGARSLRKPHAVANLTDTLKELMQP